MADQGHVYEAHIHNDNYEPYFYNKQITCESFIADGGRETESLNGFWNFHIDPYDTCLRVKWYEEIYKDIGGRRLPVDFNFDQWEKVMVPSCWNVLEDKYLYYEGPAVYTRKFHYRAKGEERVFLKIDASNYDGKIILNKRYLGVHKGGSTPYVLEITKYLEDENRIMVVVDNTRKSTNVPCRNFGWFNYGGLYRDIELTRVPFTFIKNFRVSLVPGSSGKKIKASIMVDGPDSEENAELRIDELNISHTFEVKNGYGETEIDASPELWDPDNPRLYRIEIHYQEDTVQDEVGFREIAVKEKDIYLNGRKLFLRGISCHEDSPVNGKCLSQEEMEENIRLAKDLNCNFIRLAHYPHSEKMARLADRMGIMLWEEIPVYWAVDFPNPVTYQDAENQLSELIIRDINRASVIIWCIGNENADVDDRLNFMRNLVKKAHELDDTRLVTAACMVDQFKTMVNDRLAEYLDFVSVNEYYGWYIPYFKKLIRLFEKSHIDKPVVISEFGADGCSNVRGTIDDLGTEDCQLEFYKKQLGMLKNIEVINGICPWSLFDYRCPRRINELQNGINIKGLLSYDKQHKKLVYDYVKQFFQEIKDSSSEESYV